MWRPPLDKRGEKAYNKLYTLRATKLHSKIERQKNGTDEN